MTPPTDVLLLCWRDTGHPQGGGSERYLERVGAELARRGSRVTLLTAWYPGSPRRQIADGVRVLRGGGRLTVYVRAAATLVAARFGRGRLAGYRPDVVVDTQNGVPFFASLLVDAPAVVLVHHCHREQWPVAGPVLSRVGWFVESVLSPRVHRSSRYITVSEPSAVELVELGVDRERITVVRNGVDPVPDGVGGQRSHPGVRLIAVSRLVPHKQVEHALEAVAALTDRGVDVRLDVVGGGWWEDELRSATADLRLLERVTFHGHVDETRKHELLAGADLHLMPSRKEGWGLAVVEAAQHGVPTVGYRSSAGLTDSIVDGVTGALVEDLGHFTDTVACLVDDREYLARLGTAAKHRSDDYSWASTADGFETVFRDLNDVEPDRGRPLRPRRPH